MLFHIKSFLFFCILACTTITNPLPVTFDPGGSILAFIEKYQTVQASGGSIQIDGACLSACTLFTGIVQPDHVCVTPRAFLGFHSAHTDTGYSEDGTQIIWNIYPDDIRAWLRDHGWKGDEHPALVIMDNEELRKFYGAC